jgi:type II secretory ATPase GspE/PulE/Tfp pilus assembly ATPase PilB-like protein
MNLEQLEAIENSTDKYLAIFKILIDKAVADKKKSADFTVEVLYKEASKLEVTPINYLVTVEKLFDYDEIALIWALHFDIKYGNKSDIAERNDWYLEYVVEKKTEEKNPKEKKTEEKNPKEKQAPKKEIGVATPIAYIQAKAQFPDAEINMIPQHLLELKNLSDDGIKGYFYKIVQQCQEMGISDIHFEINEYGYEIKGRIIGELVTLDVFPMEKSYSLQQVIKNIAVNYSQLDTEQWNKSQNARIEIPERKLDLRLAFTPSLIDKFQNLVIRLLSKEHTRIKGQEDIERLGYLPADADVILKYNDAEEGLNLMSGATGSGKSRSLNSFISLIEKSRSIRTVEDPVEYVLENAVQHQTYKIIKEKEEETVNMDYLAYVLSFMRQDPDIMLVGEWRKIKELTESLLYASETGHLVFTTLHASRVTNIPNLLVNQYGLQKEDLANNVNILINQKLVKRICPNCSTKELITKESIKKLRNSKMIDADKFEELEGEESKIVNKDGCEKCRIYHPQNKEELLFAGYSGRTVLYEYLPMNLEVRVLMSKEVNALAIEEMLINQAKAGNAKTYIDIAIEKIRLGEVDLETVATKLAG